MASRTVILAGATGLVGTQILQGLLADPAVAAVHSLGRSRPAVQHVKLTRHVVDFAALPALPPADEVYLALGTTIQAAGSQAAFRAVDFDANWAVARAACAAGAQRLGLVSAMGADSSATIFYSRVKGELEDALATLPFEGMVLARPSMLTGDRAALGQPLRRGESLAATVAKAMGPLIPANYRPIAAPAVAAALLRAVPSAQGTTVLLSGAMQGAVSASRRQFV